MLPVICLSWSFSTYISLLKALRNTELEKAYLACLTIEFHSSNVVRNIQGGVGKCYHVMYGGNQSKILDAQCWIIVWGKKDKMLGAIGSPVSGLGCPSLLTTYMDFLLSGQTDYSIYLKGDRSGRQCGSLPYFETQAGPGPIASSRYRSRPYHSMGGISTTTSSQLVKMAQHSCMEGPSNFSPVWACRCVHIFSSYNFTIFCNCPLPSLWPRSCLFTLPPWLWTEREAVEGREPRSGLNTDLGFSFQLCGKNLRWGTLSVWQGRYSIPDSYG